MKLLKKLLFLSLTAAVLSSISIASFAQEADSTKRSFFINPKPEGFKTKPHSERQTGSVYLPQSGVFEVPEENPYYQIPFKGQYYLDIAVEAYREELKKNQSAGWLNKFFQAIAPFINNKFQFGHYAIYDMPVVERDNALFQSHTNDESRQ
ncbi:MAG: hypothetical protein U5J95_05255 [Balneolaceae bacterium]|nr:hypothetical protein [Balneolaceae bacterium]